MEVEVFLNRLKEGYTPTHFKIPISEKSCIIGLKAAFVAKVNEDLHQYIPVKEQESKFVDIAVGLVSDMTKWGILLNGIPGNGKTTTLYAIRKLINALDIKDPNYVNEERSMGMPIKTAKELCDAFITNKKAYEGYKFSTILGIDELGVEPATIQSYGNDYTPLCDILSYRYERRLFTVITTNIPNSEIRPKYGDRIADRMNEMFKVISMPDINFRKKFL